MNQPANLLVILRSNRPGRIGERVGQWVLTSLAAYPELKVDFADLAQMDMGNSLSAHHPRTGIYEKHAIDSVYGEWIGKPGAIVSYGAASAGLRASDQWSTKSSGGRPR